jgi:hypothetical protein
MSKKPQWGEESIKAEVRLASTQQEEENSKIMRISGDGLGEVRLRVMVGCYGPGTVEKPTNRYYWMLGESATVKCRDVDVAVWFREQLMNFIKQLDNVTLEVVQ